MTGSGLGQFSGPTGLTYDGAGNLYVLDSGNNRVVQVVGKNATMATGTEGSSFGELDGALHLAFGEHGVYIADTGNGRVESFDLPKSGTSLTVTPLTCRFAIASGLSSPAAVVGTGDLVTESFYVADTGNDRVVCYSVNPEDPTVAWNSLVTEVSAGNLDAAASQFTMASADDYRQAFIAGGKDAIANALAEIGSLTCVYIHDDQAEYYFTDTIGGQLITFPVEFRKENGLWKIDEF